MTRKQSIASLRRKADYLFQRNFVSQNPYCLICGKPTNCGHHYIPKSQSNNLRYDMDNMIAICAGCHLKHHRSGDPHIMEVVLQKKGMEWANKLNLKRRIICKFNKGYLQNIINENTRL